MTEILLNGVVWDTDRMTPVADYCAYVGAGVSFPLRLYRLPDGSFVQVDLDYTGGFLGFFQRETFRNVRTISLAEAKNIVERICGRKAYESMFGPARAAFAALFLCLAPVAASAGSAGSQYLDRAVSRCNLATATASVSCTNYGVYEYVLGLDPDAAQEIDLLAGWALINAKAFDRRTVSEEIYVKEYSFTLRRITDILNRFPARRLPIPRMTITSCMDNQIGGMNCLTTP